MSPYHSVPMRVCVALGSGLIFPVVFLATPAQGAPQEKVTICHRSSSVKNPYVEQTVNQNSIVLPNGQPTGHGLHTGPVFPKPNWGDIIPPFAYNNDQGSTSIYPGLNWDTDGQAIWNGGCEVDFTVPPDETATTTTAPGTTTTRPPGTTTSEPGATTTTRPVSTTTSPSGTTTTTSEPPPGETPTTAPPSELPPPVTDPGEGVEAVVVDPGDQVVDLGQLSPSEVTEFEAESSPGAPQAGLGGASTGPGVSLGWLTAGGVLAFVAGGATFALLRRRRSA